MFAIIESGGKQYKVAQNDVLELEKLPGEKGAVIELGNVLLISDSQGLTVGAPINGAFVSAEVISQERGDKIIVFKKKRRQNYRRKNGHRQYLTVVRVKEINRSGASEGSAKPAKKAAASSEKKAPAKKTTAKKAAE
jgi:large subunit ribosomal protein L21